MQLEVPCLNKTDHCDKNGLTFQFRVNNKDIYAKGADMVNMDYYPNRVQ